MENTEITITFRKLLDNIKRYFWILMVTVFLGIGLCIILSFVSTVDTDEKYTIQKVYAVHRTDEFMGESSVTEDLLSDILLMSNTNEFSSAIESQMEKNRFNDYTFSLDESIVRSISGNVIIFNFQAADQREAETLSEVYSDLMIKNMNNFFDDREIVLNVDLSETSARVVNVGNQESSFISVKNVFIVFLSLLLGLVIIFILTVLDKYVRDKSEISGLEDAVVLGTVRKGEKNQFTLIKSAYCIKQYIENGNIQQVNFLSFALDNSANQLLIDNLLTECSKHLGENVRIDYYKDVLKNYQSLNKIAKGNLVVFICLNADKYPDVAEGIRLLEIVGKKPDAVVYIGQ